MRCPFVGVLGGYFLQHSLYHQTFILDVVREIPGEKTPDTLSRYILVTTTAAHLLSDLPLFVRQLYTKNDKAASKNLYPIMTSHSSSPAPITTTPIPSLLPSLALQLLRRHPAPQPPQHRLSPLLQHIPPRHSEPISLHLQTLQPLHNPEPRLQISNLIIPHIQRGEPAHRVDIEGREAIICREEGDERGEMAAQAW